MLLTACLDDPDAAISVDDVQGVDGAGDIGEVDTAPVEQVLAGLEPETCEGGWCIKAPVPAPYRPRGVAAVSRTHVWSVGTRGTALRFDGVKWRPVSVGTSEDLNDVWMASAVDGWIVGNRGTLRRWNGQAWTQVVAGALDLRGVHGRSANDVWVVGDHVSLHWNGVVWAPAAVVTPSLDHVAAVGNEVFATGEGRIWRLVNGIWQPQTEMPGFLVSVEHFAIAGVGSTVYVTGQTAALGWFNSFAYRWNGQSWTYQETDGVVTDLWVEGTAIRGVMTGHVITMGQPGTSADSEVEKAAGVSGVVFGTTHRGEPQRLVSGAWTHDGWGWYADVTAVGRVGAATWFATEAGLVEWRGTPVRHFSGSRVDGVSGRSRDDVWAIVEGQLWHRTATGWQRDSQWAKAVLARPNGDVVTLYWGDVNVRRNGVWKRELDDQDGQYLAMDDTDTDVWIVGHSWGSVVTPKVARRSANGTWQQLAVPDTEVLCGIDVVAPNDIWVAGYRGYWSIDRQGTISHWNGTSWTTQTVIGATEICNIVTSPTGSYAASENGTFYERVGPAWLPAKSPLRVGSVRGMRAAADGLWLGGDGGAIVHR